MKESTYTFKYIESCNMCGARSNNFTIIGRRLNTTQGFNPNNKIGISTTIMKCKKCGLNFANPMPIPQNLQDHYGIPTEEYWASEYLTINQNPDVQKKDWEKNLGKIYSGFTSLDIGAGIGKHMLIMKSLGIDSYGIEPSKTFYNKALEYTGLSKDRLIFSSVENADFDENSFDYINFGVVLEHLSDPSAALYKATKWLKPGGKIQIEVPSSNWLIGKFLNFSYKIRGMDYVSNLSPMHKPYHLYEFSPKSFELNSALNNYRIHSYEYFVCKTFLPSIFDIVLKPIMKWTNTGMQLSLWLENPE